MKKKKHISSAQAKLHDVTGLTETLKPSYMTLLASLKLSSQATWRYLPHWNSQAKLHDVTCLTETLKITVDYFFICYKQMQTWMRIIASLCAKSASMFSWPRNQRRPSEWEYKLTVWNGRVLCAANAGSMLYVWIRSGIFWSVIWQWHPLNPYIPCLDQSCRDGGSSTPIGENSPPKKSLDVWRARTVKTWLLSYIKLP